MAKGINVGVGADTREFITGVKKGVIKPLEDAEEALDDVAKTGDKAGEKLERAFKDAQKETSDFKKEQSELGKAMSQASKKGADDLARNTKSGTSRASADLKELGNEAKQNAAETFSSFDGSAESFADGIQGTLGGVVSSLGPLGAAAGAAGAIGIGLIMSAFQKAEEESQAFKERVSELTAELIDAGTNGEASIEFIVDKLKELASETDDSKDSLKKYADLADRSGSSFKDLAQMYGQNEDALKDLWREGDKRHAQLLDEVKATDVSTEAGKDHYWALIDQANAQKEYTGYIGKSITAAEDATAAQERFAQAGGPAMEAKAQLIGTINEAYDDAAGAADDFLIKESGLFDVEAYVAAMKAREKALNDYQTMLAAADLSPEAKSFLNEQGAEAAATFLAGYSSASPGNKRELNRIWSEAGKENSGEYVAKLKAGTSKTIPAPKIARPVVPAPDMSRVEQALSRKRSFRVQVEAYARNGERIY